MNAIAWLLFICSIVPLSPGLANILYISVIPSASHSLWDKTIAMELWRKGHNVTFVTLSNEKSMENFTVIFLEGIYEKLAHKYSPKLLWNAEPLATFLSSYETCCFSCEELLKTAGIKELMQQVQDNVLYDLILYDVDGAQCLYPLIAKFNYPPVIATSAFGVTYPHYSLFGFSADASYVPSAFLPYTDKMTFFQRVHNYFFSTVTTLYYDFVYMPKQWKIAQKYFGENISMPEIERSFSFLLANHDPILDYPRALPPAVISVGGLSIAREKSITQDLLKHMDDATDGAILFSLGTNVRVDLIGADKIKAILNVFSQLKQTILWKFPGYFKNLPKNVIIRPRLPQNDILAHPNIKLFVTHGGGLSLQEALYHQVPVVGIPFFADQKFFMEKIVSRKLGLKLDYSAITTHTLLNSINEILDNPIYRNNVKKISERYRDQPEDALIRAVFWIEHAIRHGGEHLQVAARAMPFYEVLALDIWALFGVLIAVIYLITRKLISIIFKYFQSLKLKSE